MRIRRCVMIPVTVRAFMMGQSSIRCCLLPSPLKDVPTKMSRIHRSINRARHVRGKRRSVSRLCSVKQNQSSITHSASESSLPTKKVCILLTLGDHGDADVSRAIVQRSRPEQNGRSCQWGCADDWRKTRRSTHRLRTRGDQLRVLQLVW